MARKSFSEELCRYYFEQLFGEEFKSVRPNWLKSPNTNIPLELDGYCEKLGVAFEHQGIQHYEPIYGEKSFNGLKINDNFKEEICLNAGVKLIKIPDIYHYNIKNTLKEFIINECKNIGLILKDKQIDINDFFKTKSWEKLSDKKLFNKCLEILNYKGWSTEDTIFDNDRGGINVTCNNNHTFHTRMESLERECKCLECHKQESIKNSIKHTINDFHKIAESHGGKCLSKVYNSVGDKIDCVCSEGHPFTAYSKNLLTGSWCRICTDKDSGLNLRNKDTYNKIINRTSNENLKLIFCPENPRTTDEIIVICNNNHETKSIVYKFLNNDIFCDTCLNDKKIALKEKRVKEALQKENNEENKRKKLMNCLEKLNMTLVTDISKFIKINNNTKITVKCEHGHEVERYIRYILELRGCKECLGNYHRP